MKQRKISPDGVGVFTIIALLPLTICGGVHNLGCSVDKGYGHVYDPLAYLYCALCALLWLILCLCLWGERNVIFRREVTRYLGFCALVLVLFVAAQGMELSLGIWALLPLLATPFCLLVPLLECLAPGAEIYAAAGLFALAWAYWNFLPGKER